MVGGTSSLTQQHVIRLSAARNHELRWPRCCYGRCRGNGCCWKGVNKTETKRRHLKVLEIQGPYVIYAQRPVSVVCLWLSESHYTSCSSFFSLSQTLSTPHHLQSLSHFCAWKTECEWPFILHFLSSFLLVVFSRWQDHQDIVILSLRESMLLQLHVILDTRAAAWRINDWVFTGWDGGRKNRMKAGLEQNEYRHPAVICFLSIYWSYFLFFIASHILHLGQLVYF